MEPDLRRLGRTPRVATIDQRWTAPLGQKLNDQRILKQCCCRFREMGSKTTLKAWYVKHLSTVDRSFNFISHHCNVLRHKTVGCRLSCVLKLWILAGSFFCRVSGHLVGGRPNFCCFSESVGKRFLLKNLLWYSSANHHHLIIIIVILSSSSHHHLIIIISSSSHHHLIIIIFLSLSYHHHHHLSPLSLLLFFSFLILRNPLGTKNVPGATPLRESACPVSN